MNSWFAVRMVQFRLCSCKKLSFVFQRFKNLSICSEVASESFALIRVIGWRKNKWMERGLVRWSNCSLGWSRGNNEGATWLIEAVSWVLWYLPRSHSIEIFHLMLLYGTFPNDGARRPIFSNHESVFKFLFLTFIAVCSYKNSYLSSVSGHRSGTLY